jgi:hypothetical protein
VSSEPSISARAEIAGALRSLGKRPFLVLLLLSYLLALVAMSISSQVDPSSSDASLSLARASNLVVEVIGIYLQIAVVLAAGGPRAEPDADPWIRAAFKHRCFWRYFAVTILEVLLSLIGGIALIVGAAVVGGIIGLGQPAVVLERLQPIDALRRSAQLTKAARRSVAIVFFALLLVPLAGGLALLAFDVRLNEVLDAAVTIAGATTSFVATVALTRIFVKLGGAPAPPVQTLLYKGARPGST